MNYYNEFNPFAAQWLRNLIKAGQIPNGVVDERDIRDVRPVELMGYTQCHFFAGIGGWPYAFKLAGWPEDKPVWSGSCPCQPFSAPGAGNGFADERHLWPAFFHLIEQCRPVAVFGEQVASQDALAWVDLVRVDLEAAGYTFGIVDTCSAGFGAPHIRQRLLWMGNANCAGLEGHSGHDGQEGRQGSRGPIAETGISRCGGGKTNGYWSDSDWLQSPAGRWYSVQPGTLPVAVGIPGRVGQVRAYGNAINVYQAAEFIKASV